MKKEKIKFVKRANVWCRTFFEGKNQKQEWFLKKSDAINKENQITQTKLLIVK